MLQLKVFIDLENGFKKKLMMDKYLKLRHGILCFYVFVLFLAVRRSPAQPAG
jgi:hypothetical protein